MAGLGWFATIVIGGIAGWLASKFMEVRFGLFMNIVLGIVGSAVANTVLAQFHIFPEGGWLGYLVTGFLGASLLIFVVRLVRR